jgi:hypothetical protein
MLSTSLDWLFVIGSAVAGFQRNKDSCFGKLGLSFTEKLAYFVVFSK